MVGSAFLALAGILAAVLVAFVELVGAAIPAPVVWVAGSALLALAESVGAASAVL